MLDLTLPASMIAAFLLVPAGLWLANPHAGRFGLIDKPDGDRKQNQEATPLTGGYAIYVALLIVLVFLNALGLF